MFNSNERERKEEKRKKIALISSVLIYSIFRDLYQKRDLTHLLPHTYIHKRIENVSEGKNERSIAEIRLIKDIIFEK